MSFIRKIKQGNQVYYNEAVNLRVNGKVWQKHIRYIGKYCDNPNFFSMDIIHFGCIATRLMQCALTVTSSL